ncbi:methionine--tRNA ligase [Candidatus Woesearchaeota archaeon]|nr:methionine--tRNA ligase [Candidatus Woesearchaeota archaeon]
MPKTPFYITTAIDYPNAKPHIGHAYEKIVADMIARWHTLQGEDVFFLTGTDEHGQKIEKAAKEAGKTPKHFVDDMSAHFQKLCTALTLSNNAFIRTTDKKHVKTAIEILKKVNSKDNVYFGTYEGLYCTGCESFKTEKELKNGLCPDHLKAPEHVKEESYFFKLSKFHQQIKQHIEQHPEFIRPESKRNEILQRLQEPLQDLSISRANFTWGIPVPKEITTTASTKKHIIYVWFDALLNYISGIAYPTKKFQKYWNNAHHLIGKDIAWFHTVIWPAILLAAEVPLPKTVYCHGFLTVDGQKMSKTLGNVVDPMAVIEKYGTDPLRYTLLRDVPAGQDGDFSEKTLIARNNSELADALGNLLQRTTVLIQKNFHGNIPVCGTLTEKEKSLEKSIPDLQELNTLMEKYQWHHVVEKVWNYINACNKYCNDTEPWKQTNDPERLATILYTLVEHLRMISILTWPVTPASAEKIACQIGQPLGKLKDAKFAKKTKGTLAQAQILFKKIEQKTVSPSLLAIAKTTGQQPTVNSFAMLNLKVARIEKVENHPNADKLYVLTLDAGERKQIVAGVKQFYKPEELLSKQIVFISNLKPAQLRGVESQGMMLAAEKEGVVRVLEAPNAKPGEQVFVEGITPAAQQITIEDFQKVTITTKDKKAAYNGKPLQTKTGTIYVDIADGAKIK